MISGGLEINKGPEKIEVFGEKGVRKMYVSVSVVRGGKITPCCFLPEFYLGDALQEGVQKIMCSN